MDKNIFACRKCGSCCQGQGGIVLSGLDLQRIEQNIDPLYFKTRDDYIEEVNGKLRLRQGEDGYCVFFQKDRGCGIHEFKPDVCRAWPFFRGNLEDETSLAMAKEYCPGIGSEITHSEFLKYGLQWLSQNNLIRHRSSDTPTALINIHLLFYTTEL